MARKPIVSLLSILLCAANLRAADVPIVLPPEAPSNVRLAAEDLAKDLGRLYPQDNFALARSLPAAGRAILLGQVSDASVRTRLGNDAPTKPESFSVRTQKAGDLELGIIAGADARGAAFGVYQLLSQLGCGFHLSGDALPAPRTNAFDFAGWSLENAPLVGERLVFNWHNFLSGCSTWNLPDWQHWTAQSQKMGFNAIMVHAYGNNPMAGFSFQGIAKPVGYLSTTVQGRDWSTMHVSDVRRIFGGEVFDRSVFGSEAALVPDAQRTTAAQALMQKVFADAGQRGMGVYLAVDVDTPSANPQELVTLLPESARFAITGVSSGISGQSPPRLWLPNPDTPEGYSLYRTEVESLLRLYPDITKLVVWLRRGGTPWMDLKTNDLPAAWQKEIAAEIARTPEAERFWHAPGLFAVGKIIRAFERALKDCQATKTQVAAGTWGFDFLPGADRFFPAGVPLIGLDYDVIHERPQLGESKSRAPLRVVGAHRPVIPIMWAHHDDGHYIGRPYTPLPEFASKLADAGAAGYGIIHWTTRPLDLYFASLAKQVRQATKDQPLRETCGEFAAESFGVQNREMMGRYLEAWITSAPRFARETSDRFIDRPLTNIAEVVAGCRERLAMIGKADVAKATPEQRGRLDYYRGLEQFIATFFETQGVFQESQELLKKGDLAGARKLLERCHPEPVIEQFARFSSIAGMSRGEQGLVVSMNTRWLSHIIRLRQMLGMEPIRYRFGPTQHDPLAQSAGRFTFHFSTDHQLWQTLGAEETGAEIFVVPESLRGTNELCSNGIESDKPLEFSMQPILSPSLFRKAGSSRLPAGNYRLRLFALDPVSTAAGQRVFDVQVTAGVGVASGTTRYKFKPVRAKFLRLLCHGSAGNDWNSIVEIASPALATNIAAQASASVVGFEAARAFDGQQDTRWASRGSNDWIQFALKSDAALEQIDIDWFQGDRRQYRVEFLVSDDGRDWRKILPQVTPASTPAPDRVDIFARAGSANRTLELSYPISLPNAGSVEIRLTPVTGKVVLCGAILERVDPARPSR